MKNMLPIIKKELKSYFDHPTASILLVVFLIVNSFFFFRSALIQGVASLRPLFDLLPWLLLFFVPAITMRLIAEEQKSGTLDLILVQPFKLWQVISAKIIAALLFLSAALALTLSLPLTLSLAGSFDWGQVAAQYLAALFLVASLTAIGLFSSSTTKNQVIAFISSLAISFFFILSGSEIVVMEFSGQVRLILSQLSLITHYQNMSRGVVDLRDLIYFISLILSFSVVTYLLVERQRANTQSHQFRRLQIGVFLLVAISVIINLLSSPIHGRLDLTKNQLYTLSPATKKILSGLNDLVTIKLFASPALPPQVNLLQRDVKDILEDFQRFSGRNLNVEYLNPEEDTVADKARSLGITPVQFNILRQQEFTVQQGYFGLSVLYADKHETIPFIEETSNLEYQLAKFIRKLTVEEKKKIAFLTGHGEKSLSQDYSPFHEQLSQQYSVEELTLVQESEEEAIEATTKTIKDIPQDLTTLVIAGPHQEISPEEKEKIQAFLNRGGSALFLIDALNINPQFLQITPNSQSFADFLHQYGVVVNPDLTFDLRANESVSFGGGPLTYILPYPFWPKVPPVEGNPLTGDIQSVALPWASTLKIEDLPEGAQAIELLKTTPYAGVQTDSFNIAPDQSLKVEEDELSPRLMAAAIILKDSSRLLVVGDSDFLTEQFTRGKGSANLIFGLNSLDWLTQDESLISIRAKNRQPAPLVFKNENQPSQIRLFNLIGVPLIVAAQSAFHLYRRRQKTKQQYNY